MKLKILLFEAQLGTFSSLNLLDNVWKERIQEIVKVSSTKEAQEACINDNPDLLLIEIQTANNPVLKWVNQTSPNKKPLIVISSNNEMAIQAFKAGASDFLKSPVNIRELENSLLKVYKSLYPSVFSDIKSDSISQDTLLLWDNDRLKPIVIEQIVKIKSDGAYSEIHLKGERVLCSSKNIGTYEGLLKEKKFMRIHHSCLVNMDCIEYYKPGMKAFVALCDSGIEYVSKSKKREFLNRFQRVK